MVKSKAFKIALGFVPAALVLAVLSTNAEAAYLVPPGNSAAIQYTESFPTGGGEKESPQGIDGRRSSMKKTLGTENARKLEEQGAAGQAAAEFATATAPASVTAASQRAGTTTVEQTNTGITVPPGRASRAADANQPSGSSGLGEVIAQATGASSSGELGIALPLLILGAIAWAIAYLLRQHRHPAA